MRLGRKNRTERGSSMVESALVLLTFFVLLIGTIDFGQVMFFHQSLVERARSAVRYGVTNPTDTAGIKNMAVYNTVTVTGTPSAVLPNLTTAMVDVQNPGDKTTSARVVVTISGYPIVFLSPYITQSFSNLAVTVAMSSETQVP
jgi:Flp pilus assembly protein TadG